MCVIAELKGVLANQIPEIRFRQAAILLLSVLPFYAFGSGKLEASWLISGKKFDYVVSDVEGIEIAKGAAIPKRVRFLGHISEYIFYFDPNSGNVAISHFEQSKPIVIGHFED